MKLHERFSSVGSPTTRSDGHPKVTGATHYTADNRLHLSEWLGLDQQKIVFQVGSIAQHAPSTSPASAASRTSEVPLKPSITLIGSPTTA
jgi:hypothetical protein